MPKWPAGYNPYYDYGGVMPAWRLKRGEWARRPNAPAIRRLLTWFTYDAAEQEQAPGQHWSIYHCVRCGSSIRGGHAGTRMKKHVRLHTADVDAEGFPSHDEHPSA